MAKTPQVFLSYAREDRDKAEQLYARLLAQGVIPWMDVHDILPGSSWRKSIEDAIRNSDFVLILLSNNSVSKRGYVQVELRAALSLLSERHDTDVFVIPVRLEETAFPEALSSIQSVDLFEADGWSKLLSSLDRKAGARNVVEELRGQTKHEEKEEKSKRRIFVAMPFKVEMEDIYHYAISGAVKANGFMCERVDLSSFTGSILQYVREKIETSAAVIADLTGENPNVHLELGYAWGKGVPTILIAQNIDELCFDVRDQRCIEYRSIKALEESLTLELASLRSSGSL